MTTNNNESAFITNIIKQVEDYYKPDCDNNVKNN